MTDTEQYWIDQYHEAVAARREYRVVEVEEETE